jgi:hypothetical protein
MAGLGHIVKENGIHFCLPAVCSSSAELLLTLMLLRWSSASRILMQVIRIGESSVNCKKRSPMEVLHGIRHQPYQVPV